MYDKASEFLYEMGKIVARSENFNEEEFDTYNFYDFAASKITDKLNNDLNSLIRCLEIYLTDVVENIEISKKLPDINEISNLDKVISFNYTDTFKRVYDVNQEMEYDFIHGRLDISNNIEENNMVLGIDEYLEDEYKDKELDFIHFKKYFQRIYKKLDVNTKIGLRK